MHAHAHPRAHEANALARRPHSLASRSAPRWRAWRQALQNLEGGRERPPHREHHARPVRQLVHALDEPLAVRAATCGTNHAPRPRRGNACEARMRRRCQQRLAPSTAAAHSESACEREAARLSQSIACRWPTHRPARRGSCRAARPPQSRWRWPCARSPAPAYTARTCHASICPRPHTRHASVCPRPEPPPSQRCRRHTGQGALALTRTPRRSAPAGAGA